MGACWGNLRVCLDLTILITPAVDRIAMSQLVHIHPSAIIEDNVTLGPGTSVWDHVHIRRGTRLGEDCIVGEKSYLAYDLQIGNRVKINAMVYICYGVIIEDGVMISAGTIFTNDLFPRATTPDLCELRSSDPGDVTLTTHVAEGATIGAGCVIGSGLRIGRFAMVGMGSVVTRDVADFHLVFGNPARSVGCVCRCGKPLRKWQPSVKPSKDLLTCSQCGRTFSITSGVVQELLATLAPVSAERGS